MIELQNVTRRYKLGGEYIYALDKVSLKIKEGEFLAVMGPSGSGKTTLLNLVGGLDYADSGDVVVDGEKLRHLNDKKLSFFRNHKIGFIFQSFNLQPMYTALENVMLPLYFAKVAAKERRQRATEMLARVGLSDRAKHRPSELSAGQRQRVSVARALVNRPKLVLADEPTGNLDSKNGKAIIEFLGSLCRDENVTVVMVTHAEEMASLADRIVRIHDGKIKSS